jgi:hypothetical protein
MDKADIKIYQHPNPELKSFLTPIHIFPPQVHHLKNPLGEPTERALTQLNSVQVQTLKEMMAVPGVKEVYIKPNEIRMKKELSASWQEIETAILKILGRALRRLEIRIVK